MIRPRARMRVAAAGRREARRERIDCQNPTAEK
jgi:hypothetical protein